jgi:hypothetical protein
MARLMQLEMEPQFLALGENRVKFNENINKYKDSGA